MNAINSGVRHKPVRRHKDDAKSKSNGVHGDANRQSSSPLEINTYLLSRFRSVTSVIPIESICSKVKSAKVSSVIPNSRNFG